MVKVGQIPRNFAKKGYGEKRFRHRIAALLF